MVTPPRSWLVLLASVALLLAACGAGESADAGTDGAANTSSSASGDGLRVAATTPVLGEITGAVLGDGGTVTVLVEAGQDPHTLQLSARQVAELQDVDLLVVNGLGLEAALEDAIHQAEQQGVPVLEVGSALDPREAGSHDDHDNDDGADDHDDAHGANDHDDEHGDDDAHGANDHDDDEHGDDEHGDDEHGDDDQDADDDGHDHGPQDPHVWLDVARMSAAPQVIADALAAVTDGPWAENAEQVAGELDDLDAEVAEIIDTVPESCRSVATNHDVLGYFAARYGLDIPVTVIPGTSTDADPSAADFAAGIATVRAADVSVVVVEDTTSPRLAESFAADAGIEVLRLPLAGPAADGSGSGSYRAMMHAIADGLAETLSDCS